MLNLTVQTSFARAFADLMQAYAVASTRIAMAATDQGLAQWTRACRLTAQRADARMEALTGPPRAWDAPRAAQADTKSDSHGTKKKIAAGARQLPEAPDDCSFASYRTASGHATAQIIRLDDRRRGSGSH